MCIKKMLDPETELEGTKQMELWNYNVFRVFFKITQSWQ